MTLAVLIRKYLGWCPMAAAACREPGRGSAEEHHPERADSTGPVARRAVLFSRLTLAVVGISWMVALAALPHLPDTVPVHWNLYGEADGFSDRLTGAFGLPAIITLIAVLLVLLPRFDRMRGSFEDSRDIYAIVTFSTVLLLLGIHAVAMLSSAGMGVPVAMAFPALLGFFFIVVGSLMPYIRRNTTVGIRLPWTIRDETVWKKTHEHGGPVFVASGIGIVAGAFAAGQWAMPIAFVVIIAAVLYISAWSYRLSRGAAAKEERSC
jgi:uncharacterized membrane protein